MWTKMIRKSLNDPFKITCIIASACTGNVQYYLQFLFCHTDILINYTTVHNQSCISSVFKTVIQTTLPVKEINNAN